LTIDNGIEKDRHGYEGTYLQVTCCWRNIRRRAERGRAAQCGERQACWQAQERLPHAPIGTDEAARKRGPTIARARMPCSKPMTTARHPFVFFALMGAGSHLRGCSNLGTWMAERTITRSPTNGRARSKRAGPIAGRDDHFVLSARDTGRRAWTSGYANGHWWCRPGRVSR